MPKYSNYLVYNVIEVPLLCILLKKMLIAFPFVILNLVFYFQYGEGTHSELSRNSFTGLKMAGKKCFLILKFNHSSCL